jgi:putative ABC transport system ATP-binding protein
MILIEAKQVTKKFTTGLSTLTAVDRIDLSIRKGESTAIVGPSGSGKSTLLSLLAGLDQPTEGDVFFDGVNLKTMSDRQTAEMWGKRIGFVFQSFYLIPTLTAEENVRVPLELSGDPNAMEKARVWLDKVGLEQRGHHLPAQLSGGEQQRTALARAMVCEPDVLFADEPTGNLDSKTGSQMVELMFALVQEHGAALVLITHEMPIAQRAHRVIQIKDGKIV